MAIQNYNTIVDNLNQFAQNHLSLKRFKCSFFEQFDNFSDSDNVFPILYAVPNDVSFDNNIDSFSFRIYCVDILQKDRSNESAILNETLLILRDLTNWLRDSNNNELNILNTPRANPVNNFLTTFTTGWYMDVEIEAEVLTTECSIPFSSNFVVPGITCDSSYINPYLTCETLELCNGFINVVDRIDALEQAITGITGTDIYVTGSTWSNDILKLTNNTGGTINTIIEDFDIINLNTASTATPQVGSFVWNDTDGTADLILKGGNVTLQVGQETVIRVVNKTTTNITLQESNYQVVKITGAQGQRVKVDLAMADSSINAQTALGVVTETILNNQEGFICTTGQIHNINTTGLLQGETWVDGDIVYLSPTVAGGLTNIKPTAPNQLVKIGIIEHSHITQGKLFVKIQNSFELGELNNVLITTPLNNQILSFDSGSSLWKNTTPISSSFTGGTVNGLTTFTNGLISNTISATTYYNLPIDPNTFVTGFTYSNNVATIKQNNGTADLSILINTMTGLTVNGTISATTYSNLPSVSLTTGVTGILPPENGGTGVNNGAFTLTVPASIIAVGRSAVGVANRVPFYANANQLNNSSNLTYNATVMTQANTIGSNTLQYIQTNSGGSEMRIGQTTSNYFSFSYQGSIGYLQTFGNSTPIVIQGSNIRLEKFTRINGTSVALSPLDVTGAIGYTFNSTAVSLTLTALHSVVDCNNGASNIVITLPAGVLGRSYTIIRGINSIGTINVTPTAGNIETLAGTLTTTHLVATAGMYGSRISFVYNGSEWRIMSA